MAENGRYAEDAKKILRDNIDINEVLTKIEKAATDGDNTITCTISFAQVSVLQDLGFKINFTESGEMMIIW